MIDDLFFNITEFVLYLQIEGFDGDIGRVIVRLAMNKQIVKVMQATVRVVSNTEFEKFKYYSSRVIFVVFLYN